MIKQSSRGTGIDPLLTEAALESAKADRLPWVVCSEPESNEFFFRLGFREVKHHDIDLSV